MVGKCFSMLIRSMKVAGLVFLPTIFKFNENHLIQVFCAFWKQEKTSWNFTWRENHNQSWTVHLDREENSVQFQLRDLLENSMQETPADDEPKTIPLHRSSRIHKEPEKLKDFVRYWLFNPFESHFTFLHFGQLIRKHKL